MRLLSHGAGLVDKPFPKGFSFDSINEEGFYWDRSQVLVPAMRETVVIGLMVNPPTPAPQSILKGLPWYTVKPWKEGEWRRIERFYAQIGLEEGIVRGVATGKEKSLRTLSQNRLHPVTNLTSKKNQP